MSSTKRLEIHATIPVSGDAISNADTIVKLKPALDALEDALKDIDASATVTSKIVSSNPSRAPRGSKKKPQAVAA